MKEFTPEELNLICLYDPGNLSGLIEELRSMSKVLMPDEKALRSLTEGTIQKLEGMSDLEYGMLSDMLTPPIDAFPFDELSMSELDEMEV